jgi:uncharacterized membrane protein YdjX (TVP38/TMEM64 family)
MPEPRPGKSNLGKLSLAGGVLVALLAAAAFIVSDHEPAVMLREYLATRSHPGIFIVLMLVLPVLGVPISIFLVLVGIRFGVVGGVLLSAGIMFCHMALTYYLVHTFLRKWIVALLLAHDVAIPRLASPKNRRLAFVFMLIPGLPYAVKNNLLALSEMPFGPYMAINWTAQFGLSIPFIILGGVVMEMNPAILLLVLGFFGGTYLLQHYLKKKYRNRL